MDNKIAEKVKSLYFVVVSVLMYYFLNEYIDLGLHVTFRHAFALVIVASTVVLFLWRPNIARGVVGFKDACVYGNRHYIKGAFNYIYIYQYVFLCTGSGFYAVYFRRQRSMV